MKLRTAIVALLLVVSPFMLSARQAVRHHAAHAQVARSQAANPNCAFGATPPAGTNCDTSDYTVGGALSSTDAIQLCQLAGGCYGTSTTITRKQVPLLSSIRGALTGTAPIVVNNTTGAISCPTCGTTTGAAPGSAVWTGVVSGTNTYTATSAQGSFANTSGKQYMFCGAFTNASTGASTLNVDAAGALPIDVQYGATSTTAAGAGDIPGGNVSICLQQNAGATAWVKTTLVPGGTVRNPPASRPVTAFEWATGYMFVVDANTPYVTLTLPDARTLSPNGGITVVALGGTGAGFAPQSTDGVNSLALGVAAASYSGAPMMITTNSLGGAGTFQVNLGEVKTYPISWGPGMNLQTVPIPMITKNLAWDTYSVNGNCTVGGAAPATATVDLWVAADGVAPTSGTNLTPSHCNAAGTPWTLQAGLIAANQKIAAGSHIWVVGSCGASACTGTNGWLGNLAGTSGEIQIGVQP